MNNVTLMGRLTRDPNYNEVQNDRGVHHIASFYLAVPRNYSREVNFIKITAFAGQADFARDYLKKGKRVAVTGELMTGSYQDADTGKTIRTAEVTAGRIEFADGKDDAVPGNDADLGGNVASGQYTSSASTIDEDAFMQLPDDIEDQLPFR